MQGQGEQEEKLFSNKHTNIYSNDNIRPFALVLPTNHISPPDSNSTRTLLFMPPPTVTTIRKVDDDDNDGVVVDDGDNYDD